MAEKDTRARDAAIAGGVGAAAAGALGARKVIKDRAAKREALERAAAKAAKKSARKKAIGRAARKGGKVGLIGAGLTALGIAAPKVVKKRTGLSIRGNIAQRRIKKRLASGDLPMNEVFTPRSGPMQGPTMPVRPSAPAQGAPKPPPRVKVSHDFKMQAFVDEMVEIMQVVA